MGGQRQKQPLRISKFHTPQLRQSQLCFQFQRLAGDRVREFQALRQQQLGFEALFPGKGHGRLAAVLRIPQDGEAHVGAMEPQLMGASGNGLQRQAADLCTPLQNMETRDAGLAVRADLPQKAGQFLPGDGGVNGIRRRTEV